MLRKKHPRFVYRSYDVDYQEGRLIIYFNFLLEPGIEFRPVLSFPCPDPGLTACTENLIFHLGLVEMISYWKCACPPRVIIEAGSLSDQQAAWWHDLFIHGLGEFFYRNGIDFTTPDLLKLESGSGDPYQAGDHGGPPGPDRALILVGGGKDSLATLELLKDAKPGSSAFALNPTRASLDSVRIAGYPEPLVARRRIDAALLKLNEEGYLNGHTPFSAYLAFLGTLVAAVNGYRSVISSNEYSANEANLRFHGLEVNHQYSKTFRFETLFRSYCRKWLTAEVSYFSFLRPLLDLQISRLTAKYETQLLSFRSCNVNQKKDSWCGQCPKCAFVYLCLFPFVEQEKMAEIFGGDLFAQPAIIKHIADILGLEGDKPFECVGTAREAEAAVVMSIKRYQSRNAAPPGIFAELARRVAARNPAGIDYEELLDFWNGEHCLPADYETLLKNALHR